MAEKRTGAGLALSGVLERATPPKSAPAEATEEAPAAELVDAGGDAAKGRGGRTARRTPAARQATRTRPRTIHLPDDLFERVLVQSHRRNLTISEYVAMLLERQVPDHRVVRQEPAEGDAA